VRPRNRCAPAPAQAPAELTGVTPRQACAAARAVEFPHLGDVIYLNTASYGPQPQRALAAMRRFEDRRAAVQLLPEEFGSAVEQARAACAALINGDPGGIALGPNTSVGLNLAATLVRARAATGGAGRVIVVSDGEFPANVYPWMALERDGFTLARLPLAADGCPDEDAMIERVARGDVAALAISAVQFASGCAADLERLGAACRAHDVLFVVDAIQAVGAIPIDVDAAQIDVLACGGHKWLCAPFGTGFTYIRRALVEVHEPELPGWLAFASSADFEHLLSYEWDLWPDARRFEVGSLAIQGFVALASSAALIAEIGITHIREHVRALQQPLLDWAGTRAGVRPAVPDEARRAAILALYVPDAAALDAALGERRIITVTREGAVRFAPHFYNTMDEMARVTDALDALSSG
jgi:cysteine desulfurase / selenocysteine lyase